MTINVGTTDRILRAIAGGILLLLSIVSIFGTLGSLASAGLGIVLVATAGMRFCPAYRLLGIQTCKT